MTDHRDDHDNREVDGEENEALWFKARNAGLSRRTFLALLPQEVPLPSSRLVAYR